MLSKFSPLKRLIPAFGLALIAVLALSALAAGSASATTQRWYSCHEGAPTSGGYTDSGCQKQGIGAYEWNESASSTSFALSSEYVLIKGTLLGKSAAISCWDDKAGGTMKNPAGGAAGTLTTESPLTLSECFVEEPVSTCKIKEGKITFNQLKGTATEFEGKSAVQLSPESGTTLASVTIEGCKGYSGTYTLQGTAYANVNPATSTLEITEAGSKGITFAGNPARFESWMKISAASENVRLNVDAPSNVVAPFIWDERPTVGNPTSLYNGRWTNSPTSYEYQWKRCDYLAAHCANISAATGSAYTPTSADIGQRLIAQVTAKNVGGSTQALSTPTKVIGGAEGKLFWYSCAKGGAGAIYADAACFEQSGSGLYTLSKLGSSSTPVTSTVTTPIALSWSAWGEPIVTTCSTYSGTGTSVANPSGASGTFEGSSLKLSGCTVTKPATLTSKCTVDPISLGLSGTPVEAGGAFTLTNAISTQMYYHGTGCVIATPLSGWSVEGNVTGVIDNTTNTLGFSKSGTEGLKVGGNPASLEGATRLETSTGARLRLAP